jgi:S-methylmethionine-dependent homocysteine/selenocysteine methylase
MTALADRLARASPLILDGGTGTELERRGVVVDEVAWAGAAVLEHAGTLAEVHADFIRAGAEVVIANTLAAGRYLLEAAGLGDKVREINTKAVEAAKAARDRSAGGREVWVAGSISYFAPAADPGRRPDVEAAAASFREQAEILAESGVDLIALEMMRQPDYAVAALEAAEATGLPVWVGFSCVEAEDADLVVGPDIADPPPLAAVIGLVMARGGSLLAVMHTDVELTCRALEAARDAWPGPLGAYPHSGVFRPPHWDFDSVMPPEAFLAEARQWVARGARAVGGCCGIGPAHIRLLAESLR